MQPPSFPTVGHEVSGSDWGVIYGPLGLMAAVFLVLLVLLWRWARIEIKAARAEVKAAQERADGSVATERERTDEVVTAARAEASAATAAFVKELREMTVGWQATVKSIAHEQNEAMRSVTDKYHDHAVALRAVIETTQRRIGRRGD